MKNWSTFMDIFIVYRRKKWEKTINHPFKQTSLLCSESKIIFEYIPI